jgi:glucokinase
MTAWIGLLLGSRDSVGALVGDDGRVLARVSVPNANSPTDGVPGLLAMVRRLRSKGERIDRPPLGIGVGFPGVIEPADGSVRGTRAAWRSWTGFPLAAELGAQAALPVVVRNDVVSILAGERAVGAARGATDVVLAYASYGVGGAAVIDGALVLGPSGSGGHLGHIPVPGAAGRPCSCGGEGHVDAVSSGEAMTDAYRKRAGLTPGQAPYLRVVSEAALGGDQRAQEVLTQGGLALGRALGGIANFLAPALIVLAGGCIEAPGYRAAVERALLAEVIPGAAPPVVVRSGLGGDAQVIGAALAARDVVTAGG